MALPARSEPNVYVLACDVNGFAKLESNIQTKAVEVIDAELQLALAHTKTEISERVFHSFGGDGFMLVVAPSTTKALDAGNFVLKFLTLAVNLHLSIRSKFEKIQEEEISSKPLTLRMGLNHDKAVYLPKTSSRKSELPLGDALNDAQRIMDNGRDWHILVADHLVDQIQKEPTATKRTPLTGERFREYKINLGNGNVSLTECPGLFKDKQKKEHVLWRLHCDEQNLGVSMPPPKGPRHVTDRLEPSVLYDVTRKIENSVDFFSVSLMPAAIWLTDPTLTAVLIAQAKRIAIAGAKRSCHHRVFVWDSSSQSGNQRQTLEHLHKEAAKVSMSVLTHTDMLSVVNIFKDKLEEAQISQNVALDFVNYPVREFWIATNGQRVISAGYGVDKDADGSYDVLFPLDDSLEAKKVALFWKASLRESLKASAKE